MNSLELAAVAACALPLLGAIANGVNALVGGRLYGATSVSRVAVAGVFGAFAASVWVAAAMTRQTGPHEIVVYQWFASGDLAIDFAFLIDELTIVMMLVVTAISWLVTRFSVNYMHNEDGFGRYFTIVPLFVFAMLVLVMADNYLLLFLGWEGVGVCSYLLVGFYRDRAGAAEAGTRAFIMNRVGDAGLLVAMFLLVVHTGSLRFGEVLAAADSLSSGVVTGICFLLLLGAVGKSAQLPLGTWLARAMEGPTPSSALIHAATMVTAGVYLVVRSSPLFDAAPTALLAVGLVGALTALYGQFVGYVQTDIKGMLAASTTAQLGFMFVLCGLGLYTVAIFHLIVHAFYKSYLFLTAPSILHHLHGGADPSAVRRPADTVPVLSYLVLAAALGLLGLPLLGGGLSGGGSLLESNVWVLAALAVVAAFSVLFATVRMVGVGFASHQADDGAHDPHAHDPHADGHVLATGDRIRAGRLLGPLAVIVGLAAVGWAVGVLPGGIEGTWFHGLLAATAGIGDALPAGNPLMAGLFIGTLALLAVSGVYGPRFLDRFRDELPAGAVPSVARRLYWRALHRGLLDETYARAFVGPTAALGQTLQRFDRPVSPSSATPAAGSDVDWEARFASIRRAHTAGFVTLAEPPTRLDWLPPAAAPSGGSETAVARFTETVERVVFQGSPERGADLVTSAIARSVETVERVVFQANLERVASLLTSAIARFIEGVEQIVFQTGVERGVNRASTMGQRSLFTIESRLGQPQVIGGLLVVVLVVLVVGTR
jgi:NADH-quinone oxidoreductase subunit L